jgi:hypothetical protein
MLNRVSLERAANIAILALVPICAASWIYYYVATPTTARARTTPALDRYAQGDTLVGVPELAALPAVPTALLFLNSNCRFCTQSMPFYGRLLAQTRAQNPTLRVVVASREPMTPLKPYIERYALQLDDVVALPGTTTFKQNTTPAVMLLDADRRITRIWFGLVSASDEPRVLGEIAQFRGLAQGAVTAGSK